MDLIDETVKNLVEGNENVELLNSLEIGTNVRLYNRRNKGNSNWILYSYVGKRPNYYGQGEDEYVFRDRTGDYTSFRTSELISMPKDSIKIPKYNVNPRNRYNDAVDLKCSECGTVTRFYYASIKPYMDFYEEEYKFPEEIKCPVCGTIHNTKADYGEPNLSLDKLCFGCKSPDGRKYDIVKEGSVNNEK